MDKVRMRGIVSTALIVIFIIVAITGIIMIPALQEVLGIGDQITGKGKSPIEKIHTLSGILMVILCVVHFILNYNMLRNELKLLGKKKKNKE